MDTTIKGFLLISANIGSTFDFPDRMFTSWIDGVALRIQEFEPIFFAIHCQEVGGKNYEESMQYVDNFVKLLLKNPILSCYNKARIYLDEDFTVEEKFTALGSFYFIHESISNVEQWDFVANEFIPVEGRELFSANIEHVSHKFKEKFPLEFFPENKWSRKGFIHTRWKIFDIVVDFVNIHLFHDICNLASIVKDPSTYSACRSRALDYTLKKVTKDWSEKIPLFIFGDFNFRLTTQKLIKQLVEPRTTIENVYKKSQGKSDEIRKIVYRKLDSPSDKNKSYIEKTPNGFDTDKILEIGRKIFDMYEFNNWFVEKSELFRVFDEEPGHFFHYLYEFPISFPPSYPFNEEEIIPNGYMKTRCPSWCDRIFLNPEAKNLLQYNNIENVKYHMIGLDSCVGDHKPIFLSFCLKSIKDENSYVAMEEEESSNEMFQTNETNFANDSKYTTDGLKIHATLSSEEISVPTTDIENTSSNRRLFHSVINHEFSRRKRHSVVDSINGLRASIDIDKYNEMWNIFDNGRFDKETELDMKFRLSHRPYIGLSSSADELSNTQSNFRTGQSLFIQAARNITTAESVISAFRQSINRKRKISDSSSENDPEDQNNKTNCDDIIVETYQINDNNAIYTAQDVPKMSYKNKIFKQKNSCCIIS